MITLLTISLFVRLPAFVQLLSMLAIGFLYGISILYLHNDVYQEFEASTGYDPDFSGKIGNKYFLLQMAVITATRIHDRNLLSHGFALSPSKAQ